MNEQEARDERARIEQSNDVAWIVFEQIKKAWPDLHPVLDLRYGIADAIWSAGYRKDTEPEWEYEARPYTSDPDEEEWGGRPVAEAEQLIREHADPGHWIHAAHNDDLAPVVGYRTYRRTKAGPWEQVNP